MEGHTRQRTNAATLSLAPTASEHAPPPRPSVVDEKIGRYRLRRLLGEGGMGQVYLARDISLGRSIALKIVGAGARHEGFHDEARAIARLNHPNIVQLYDFGEYKSGLYLALEYVDGDTLRERARHGPLGLDEVLRHVRAIADALVHAHAAGVFHCDLKPSNVMIGRDGRVRVVDFGLAHTGDSRRGMIAGTPDWMSPEQWEGLALTDKVDSWALGVIAAQLLTGSHPLGDEPEARHSAARDPDRVPVFRCDHLDVPPAVIGLVTRSIDWNPALRPSAAEWKAVIEDAINGRGDAFAEDGPYPGLGTFYEAHARFYFGREREIDEFVERLREVTVLPIVGPSGAGKSSFLHAGVIPRLRARERWIAISFRPGQDPVASLARQVIITLRNDIERESPENGIQLKLLTQAFRAELLDKPTLLAARLATLASALNAHVLLAVDQLEEAFTQCASADERARFLQMLLSAADDVVDPVRVVFTVRDDFLGQIAGLRTLFVMQKLGAQDLRRTITGPLARCRYEFDDPSIVDDLIAEVGTTEVANLPLLQFACRTLWEDRDPEARRLRRETYRAMGGLAGALARHAERALSELAPEQRRTARTLMLQLVSGTTRRTIARELLLASAGEDAEVVLDRLVAARLVVQRSHRDGDGPTVEIAHESLLQTWAQLARWLDETRDERRLIDEIDDAASLWERRGKRADETWAQSELVAARHRAAQLQIALPPRIEAFLEAGETHQGKLRRNRRIRYGIALAIAGAIAVIAITLVGRYLAREQLIASNAGTVDLVLAPYDWIDGAPVPVPVSDLPDLDWKLHAADPNDPHVQGGPLPDNLIDRVRSSAEGVRRTDRVIAPGGMVFLEITGRGRSGERCASSWIRIQSFPGYGGRSGIKRFELDIPTCQATTAEMERIEEGEFIYGGTGVPASKMYGADVDYTLEEQRISLPAFDMDLYEVSNARFEPFAKLEKLSGYPKPQYSNDPVHAHDGKPGFPVTEVDAFEAQAFCRYLGKRLPRDKEWVKAARGGIHVRGQLNPAPARLYPWGTEFRRECVNEEGKEDDWDWVAPVRAYECGRSPYGIWNLVGNVQEWMSADDQPDNNPLRVMRGGAVDSPRAREHTSTIFINHWDPRSFTYNIGFRCVSDL